MKTVIAKYSIPNNDMDIVPLLRKEIVGLFSLLVWEVRRGEEDQRLLILKNKVRVIRTGVHITVDAPTRRQAESVGKKLNAILESIEELEI